MVCRTISAELPNCFLNVSRRLITKWGGVKRSIDFDKLRQLLSSDIVEGNEERYQFTWPDKRKAILAANAPINATLPHARRKVWTSTPHRTFTSRATTSMC